MLHLHRHKEKGSSRLMLSWFCFQECSVRLWKWTLWVPVSMERNGRIPPGQKTTTGLRYTTKHFSCKLEGEGLSAGRLLTKKPGQFSLGVLVMLVLLYFALWLVEKNSHLPPSSPTFYLKLKPRPGDSHFPALYTVYRVSWILIGS